jgi:ankyrin repeat protein
VLLKHGADPNSMNQCRFGGLAFATQRACEQSAHILLSKGALVDQTSMQNAVHHGMHRTLARMLSAEARTPDGAVPDANQHTDGGAPLLLLAACRGHTACIRVLLSNGAHIDAVNPRGASALTFATKKHHSSAALLLLEEGAHVDRNALHNTVRNGMRRVLSLMLERGADPSTKTNRGAPLLAVAAGWQHLSCCELLLRAGADVNAVNSMGSRCVCVCLCV